MIRKMTSPLSEAPKCETFFLSTWSLPNNPKILQVGKKIRKVGKLVKNEFLER